MRELCIEGVCGYEYDEGWKSQLRQLLPPGGLRWYVNFPFPSFFHVC